jgi:serine kinase of HPr protein (carbohydrate metabolism regulator)
MESGTQFYRALLDFDGMMLHASAVALDGKAYLFSGQSGIGKSTHTGLWQKTFGDGVKLFNDDKPALRRIDGKWYAYGTPWSGKHGININMKVPIAGICFLKRGDKNEIRRLSPVEALPQVLAQTLRKFKDAERLSLMLGHVDKLVKEVPIYELRNLPEPEAARLSYETMRQGAKEANL